MNQQQVQFADVVAEELLRQNTVLTRDLAIARAEAFALKQENEMLKQQQASQTEAEPVEAELVS